MGIRFRKRVKIAPGVNLNFSKSGTSVTVGGRGASVNIGKNGVYGNAGIPGTGIYMREKIVGRKKTSRGRSARFHTPQNVYSNVNISTTNSEPAEISGCVMIPFCIVLGVFFGWGVGNVKWAILVTPVLLILMTIIKSRNEEALKKGDVDRFIPNVKQPPKDDGVLVDEHKRERLERLALEYEDNGDMESAYDNWSILFNDMCEKKEYSQYIAQRYIDCTRKTVHASLEAYIYEDLMKAFPEHPNNERWKEMITNLKNE